MLNQEYALAIPIERLVDAAIRYSGAECTARSGCAQSASVQRAVREIVCPCIREDARVCHALAREFESHARRAGTCTHRGESCRSSQSTLPSRQGVAT